MSAYHERRYEMERRQEIAAKRVRQTTKEYYDRYKSIMEDIKTQGLVEFVSEEYSHLTTQLSNLHSLLTNDPFAARDISLAIGQSIHALPRTARGLCRTMDDNHYQEQVEKQIKKKAKEVKLRSDLELVWQQGMLNWQDKLSRNLVLKELSQLKNVFLDESSVATQIELEKKITSLKLTGDKKAKEHRSNLAIQSKSESNVDLVQQIKKDLDNSNISQERVQSLSDQLESINDGGRTQIEIESILLETSKDTDRALENESIRKEVVKAVYKSLTEAGFIVQKPVWDQKNGKDEVVIAASRPSGNRALFQIEVDGKLLYKFDNYKGQTCQKDMQAVLPKLSEVYGVDLSGTRVLWSNPDDEDAEMKPIPTLMSNQK